MIPPTEESPQIRWKRQRLAATHCDSDERDTRDVTAARCPTCDTVLYLAPRREASDGR